MPFFILSIILQIALVVHIVKTGRNTMWIWIVVMLPLAGAVAYVVVEILPELMAGRTGRKLKRSVENVVAPNKTIETAVRDFSVADTVENAIRLADECMKKGMFDDAKQLYEKSLKGIHESDPEIMYGLARAEFALNNHQRTKFLLDDLIAKNPSYKNADAHLLYARTAEALHDIDLAIKEYEVLAGYYPGPEAACRYALLLKSTGHRDRALGLFEKIVRASKTSGKHYNDLHREWIDIAKRERGD